MIFKMRWGLLIDAKHGVSLASYSRSCAPYARSETVLSFKPIAKLEIFAEGFINLHWIFTGGKACFEQRECEKYTLTGPVKISITAKKAHSKIY